MFRNNDISDGGRPVLIEAPEDEMIALADVKKALGISGTSQDNALQFALDAAIAALDPSSGGWLGRALMPQTWELQLLSFNDRRAGLRSHHNLQAIPLPYPPLLSIVSVKYLDMAGADQTLALGAGYRVLGVGQVFSRQAIAPPYGGSWPATRVDDAAVRIRYTCGYDDDANVMPKQMVQAICLSVRALLPLMTRDVMLLEDRVEGIGSKRYQSNPEISSIVEKAIGSLLVNLATA
jgi:uncharacterized phiE125 gp8 family phage protein